MGNMKFDGADVTFELDGYDALVERVRSKKVNCKINPADLPRLYAVMDAELEGNEELAAAFAEAQELSLIHICRGIRRTTSSGRSHG